MGSLPIFTITIFVSAFLLFLVQPLIGKLILPKLGGTPQVWNTCMVFFQFVLLLGYSYSHMISTRLKLRQQLIVHGVVLAIPIVALLLFARGTLGIPIYGAVQDWSPPPGSNPMVETFWLLFTIIGIPFFVVSTSASLLTRWFTYSGHAAAKDPYFLYSASNIGSLLSLLFYPAVEEPNFLLQSQSYIWFVGYVFLAACVLTCVYTIYKVAAPDEQLAAEAAAATAQEAAPPAADAPAPAPPPTPAPAAEASTAVKSGPAPGTSRGIQRKKGIPTPGGKADDRLAPHAPVIDTRYGAEAPMTWLRRVRWVLLCAVSVSLMLGVTNYVSTDVSPFPALWMLSLSLYLLSFIIVFARWPFSWTGKRLFNIGESSYTMHDAVIFIFQPLGLLALSFIVLTRRFDPVFATTITMLGFFAIALACHGEFAKDRPKVNHLTEYFLLMSFGGVIGGIFNAIFAPLVLQRGVFEFHIAIVIACMVRPETMSSGWFDELLMNAFPGLRSWARTQGDEMAKSLGRTPSGTTYMFNFFLDVVMGLFIFGLAWWLSAGAWSNAILNQIIRLVGTGRNWNYFFHNAWVFGIPMVFCFFFAGRPMRMGLALTGLMFANLYFAERDDKVLEARRTYFGVLRVMAGSEGPKDAEERNLKDGELIKKYIIDPEDKKPYVPPFNFTYLMHGTTYHGRNYIFTKKDQKDGYIKDASRLATTYYHRYGPVGIVMEQYNWFPGKQNTFYADVRMPVTMVGQIAAGLGSSSLPLSTVIEPWSEPSFATIGLGTGTMASYARPYGYMTYYEIDDVIRGFSIPGQPEAPPIGADVWSGKTPKDDGVYWTADEGAKDATLVVVSQGKLYRPGTGSGEAIPTRKDVVWAPFGVEPINQDMSDADRPIGPYRPGTRFTYLQNAVWRGVNLEIIMGDARLSLEPKREKYNTSGIDGAANNSYVYHADFRALIDPKDRYYMGAPFEHTYSRTPNRDKFYKAIVVDAFSSDAIPVHLITRQAIEIYMNKLTQDGVLLVHTSNRHMDLVRPVARIAMDLSREAVAKATAISEYLTENPSADTESCIKALAAKGYKVNENDVNAFSDKELRHFWSDYVWAKTHPVSLDKFFDDEKPKDLKAKEPLEADKYDAAKAKEAYIKSQEVNCLVGKDGGDVKEGYLGHFSSEYVMLYRGDGFSKWVETLKAAKEKLNGKPPAKDSILNSVVQWYDPYTDHVEFKNGRMVKVPITQRDPIWTDDYSFILGVLR